MVLINLLLSEERLIEGSTLIYRDIVEEMKKENIKINNLFEDVVILFRPFFLNEDNLKRYSKNYLLHDYINYTTNNFRDFDSSILEVIIPSLTVKK